MLQALQIIETRPQTLARRDQKPWSADDVEELRRLALIERLSALQIGERMSRSRNSIIGAVHRNKITLARATGRHTLDGDAPRKRKPRKRLGLYNIIQPVFDRGPVTLRVARVETLNVTFEELKSDQCRYPVTDDSPFFFCGHSKLETSAYCAAHHRLCYQPARGK